MRTLQCILISLGWGLISPLFAIEVEKEVTYYTVTPNPGESIFDSIVRDAPPSSHQFLNEKNASTLGEYQPKVEFETHFNTHLFKRCTVSRVDITLHSHFYLPKLNTHYNYSYSVTSDFNREYRKILDHEEHHEAIYIFYLKELKKEIERLGRKRLACDDLSSQIKALEDKTLERIEEENRLFDCREYGTKMGWTFCDAPTKRHLSNKLKSA